MRQANTVARLPIELHSVEAEQALLGALLIDCTAWPRVVDLVRAGDLRPDHKLILSEISTLAGEGNSWDVVTIAERLQRRGRLEDAGGMAYLSEIARNTPTSANARAYAEVVRDRSALRALAGFAANIEHSIADGRGRSADELIAAATEALLALQAFARIGKGLISSEELARELVDDLDRRREKRTGLEIGLADFDELTGGLEPGDLVVIASRPAMGKTSLLTTIAAHVGKSAPAAVFSAEMPAQQLMRRCVALVGSISQTKLRRAEELTEIDWTALWPAIATVARLQLWIDDAPLPELSHIRAEAFALKARHGLRLVLVDYVQLVQGSGANRYEQLRDVAYGFKALAKELAIPVIVLAQLNRSVESREHKRPHLSDLRDSGAIEEAADIVGLLYSEGYYDAQFGMPYVLECNIEKHRNGERGQCLWNFSGQCSRATVLAPGERAQYLQLRAKQRRGGGGNDL